MSVGFVSLADLLPAMPEEKQTFLAKVIARDKNLDPVTKEWAGTDKGIVRQMQNPICQKCHEDYKRKFPGKPFGIKCIGINDEQRFLEKQMQMRELGEDMSIDEIRDIYDPAHWVAKNIVVKDPAGDYITMPLRWYQTEALSCTAMKKVDRWARGMGKALPLDTPIPTPSGWTTMGELKVGDEVLGDDGLPTKVTFATEIMHDHVVYDVVFSDGSVISADAEHLWETWTHNARQAANPRRTARRKGKLSAHRQVPKPEVRTTEDIRSTLLHGNGKRVEHNHSIPVTSPIQLKKKKFTIDPYVLGAWLGDGISSSAGFTSNDLEIIQQIRSTGMPVSKRQAKYAYYIGKAVEVRDPKTGRFDSSGSFHSALKSLNVLDNKHIPQVYLRGSFEQRLSLLQGLMDTDGTISVSGTCSFDNTNEHIARGVFELAASLGLQPFWRTKRATLNGKDCGTCFRVGFTTTLAVFRLKRKLERVPATVRSSQSHRFIVDIIERESVPVRCITVANKRHMYLVGRSFIPTHNTSTGIGEELHMALTRKKLEIIIVCPQQTQAEMWYTGILEQIENSPPLAGVLAQQKQSPFFLLRFNNGSIIKIFTAGSGSGKKGGAVRGQNPRRIRLDEQDFLAEGDYDAIMPLIRRFKELTFHGSSTPTGLRGMYYKMCRQFPDYKEFFYPITDHPDWTEDKREEYILEAKTMDRFIHEFLAEFGDPAAGVFKSKFVDEALMHYRHVNCRPENDRRHVMGIDWNGQGTGTRIYVVQYDPTTRKRRTVDRAVIDDPASTTAMSIEAIKRLNRKWMCDHIYVDAGFGFAQDELIRSAGQIAKIEGDLQTAKLKNIKKIDFGGSLEFNLLVPNREVGQKRVKGEKDEELKRPTKPFMVEGTTMAFEQGLVELDADDDKILEEQARGYRVKNWSSHGTPSSYETDAESGDHDLDAFMLAMLGVEIEYGLFQTKEAVRRLAQISHVAGWGSGPSQPMVMRGPANPLMAPPTPVVPSPEENRESAVQKAGVSRVSTMKSGRVMVNGRSAAGGNSSRASRIPPRTVGLGSGRSPVSGASPFHTIGNGIRFGSAFTNPRFGR